MVNMDRPRTVFTSSLKSVPQILAWSDPEDTVINCTLDHFDRSLFYENQCSEKSVHYLSASLTNDAFLVGGKKRVFSTHEPLILHVRQKCTTRRGYAGVRPFRENGSRRARVCHVPIDRGRVRVRNGNIPVVLSLMDKAIAHGHYGSRYRTVKESTLRNPKLPRRCPNQKYNRVVHGIRI
jgi:hypothetical protein